MKKLEKTTKVEVSDNMKIFIIIVGISLILLLCFKGLHIYKDFITGEALPQVTLSNTKEKLEASTTFLKNIIKNKEIQINLSQYSKDLDNKIIALGDIINDILNKSYLLEIEDNKLKLSKSAKISETFYPELSHDYENMKVLLNDVAAISDIYIRMIDDYISKDDTYIKKELYTHSLGKLSELNFNKEYTYKTLKKTFPIMLSLGN